MGSITENTLALPVRQKDGVKFGKELREKDFMFEKGYLNLNHGSFGTYPRSVRDTLRSFQDAAEARPDDFIRYKYPTHLNASRAAIADLINAPPKTVVFVPNATSGVNTVLRNLAFEDGDHILYFATIYRGCDLTVQYITETTPAQSARVEYTYPVEDDWLVEAFKQKVRDVQRAGGRVKVAIFDTVVSMPGVRVPFEQLTAVCKELGVLSLVDAAHGVGHVELDVGRFDPDFLTSNCHKWLHVPRGCATLYVPVRNQHLIRSTLPTSWGFKNLDLVPNTVDPKGAFGGTVDSEFVGNFEFVGTIDSSPYLCIPKALEWRKSIGGEKVIMEYCTKLAQNAGQLVAKALGTDMLDNKTKTMSQCCMSMVRLPVDAERVQQVSEKAGLDKAVAGKAVTTWLLETMCKDYNTFLQTLYYDGAWWARLSGQVYLELSDFESVVAPLKELCERANKGEWA
ncbi:pyridoxal phosphate-dependent transferase [Boeremia exigua]|uniref:pyridoxal phosphate-dependent transferase n=1 Tax=Boeremia exigua TaxID=749465 RepID=UPI001E8D5F7F|nr:pyridoxal phosphate-dependent transferase [Boeremia exigua]KAH6629536.1 pyridoxal phosphate-dependent transferase [Boeremia exigua]